jgi:hypothetical protein
MKKIGRLSIAAIVAACCLGLIQRIAGSADVEPFNPPRTQQDIMKERFAACRDLHGSALKECMANYVGKPDKSRNFQTDPAEHDRTSREPPTPPVPPLQAVAPARKH